MAPPPPPPPPPLLNCEQIAQKAKLLLMQELPKADCYHCGDAHDDDNYDGDDDGDDHDDDDDSGSGGGD